MSRVIIDSRIFKNPAVNNPEEFYAWVWILAHCDDSGRLHTSLGSLSAEWFWTRARAQRFVARLEKENMVTVSVSDRETVLTIVNWDKYQKPSADTVPAKERKAPAKIATQYKHPTEAFFEWCEEKNMTAQVDVAEELEKFRDYHQSKGNTFRDWDAAARNWMRNAIKFNRRSNVQPSSDKTERNRDKLRSLLGDDQEN